MGEKIEKVRSYISWIMAAMLMFGLISSIINIKFILIAGLILTLTTFVLGSIYGLFMRGLTKIERIIIFAISLILLIRFIFGLQHWIGAGIAQIALIIPIALFIYVSFKMPEKLKPEFPFLLIMAVFALMTFFGI